VLGKKAMKPHILKAAHKGIANKKNNALIFLKVISNSTINTNQW